MTLKTASSIVLLLLNIGLQQPLFTCIVRAIRSFATFGEAEIVAFVSIGLECFAIRTERIFLCPCTRLMEKPFETLRNDSIELLLPRCRTITTLGIVLATLTLHIFLCLDAGCSL